MAWINPLYEEYQRRRWLRHDWQRFLTPAGLEAEKRAAEERARAVLAAEQKAFEDELWQVRRDLAALKVELAARRAARMREAEALRRKSDFAWDQFFRTFKRYAAQQKAGFNPAQPRDDHGKWTDSGRDAGKDSPGRDQPPTNVSAQRRIGPRPTGTPAQHARLDAAIANARDAVARVQQLDPNWRPASMMSREHPRDMEAMIRTKESETREAEARFIALSRAEQDGSYPRRDAPGMAEVVKPRGELVGSRIPNVREETRTVTPSQFEEIRLELMGGARRIEPDARYDGVWYKRQDGSIFGLRLSADHGLTMDIIQGNDPVIPRGLRIHQR